ncbi:MAG: glutamine synthetase, partial [Anaerotignum sp.]|nr:glutamine synthetase [Anaerotignum sp.]
EDFYLETNRIYRSELDVFEEYTQEERDKYFGEVPETVWENLCAFDQFPEKLEIFKRDDVMKTVTLESYHAAILSQWVTELHNRIVPNTMDLVRQCVKCHDDNDCVDYDWSYWGKINAIRNYLGRDTMDDLCLLTRIVRALDSGDYQTASDLQLEMQDKVKQLTDLYIIYKKNLF